MNVIPVAQLKASTTVTRKQVPVTQFQGVRTNLEETTVEPVLKNMPVNSAIAVRMNIMVIPIAIIVNASQATPKMLLMFVMKKMATAHAQRVTLADNVMNVALVTPAIQTVKFQVCNYIIIQCGLSMMS